MWTTCPIGTVFGTYMAIMMPMSWVLSLNYETTGSWNAKVELGSIQRREKCLSPLPPPLSTNICQLGPDGHGL